MVTSFMYSFIQQQFHGIVTIIVSVIRHSVEGLDTSLVATFPVSNNCCVTLFIPHRERDFFYSISWKSMTGFDAFIFNARENHWYYIIMIIIYNYNLH